jgi:ubiquinone/menaquinone biosynthesis C-methylase UbiE
MLGHVREMEAAYAELSRVCCMGGVVIVTDLSTESVAAGHKRTFRDADGATRELEHFAHTIERQAVAAFDVGLRLERQQDGVVDESVMPLYVEARRQAVYEEQLGMPLVRALLWRKNAS